MTSRFRLPGLWCSTGMRFTFPFRSYQIQPVWRADRPQKGRYREFYQCDADVIGSDSLVNEAELVQSYRRCVFSAWYQGQDCINNRKSLQVLQKRMGSAESITGFTIALDKLDKMGSDKVLEELREKGFSSSAMEKLIPLHGFQRKQSGENRIP